MSTFPHAKDCVGGPLITWESKQEPMVTCRGCRQITPAAYLEPPTRTVCPVCTVRPPRDQRPGSRRGECRVCWTARTRREERAR